MSINHCPIFALIIIGIGASCATSLKDASSRSDSSSDKPAAPSCDDIPESDYIYYDSPIRKEVRHDFNNVESMEARGRVYCEIMPVFYDKFRRGPVTESYNTYMLNECESWSDATDPDTIQDFKDRYGAKRVIMNGPRAWVLDDAAAFCPDKSVIDNKVFSFVKGMQVKLGAQIESADFGDTPYEVQNVRRWNTWTYKGGCDAGQELQCTVYELTDKANKHTYIMQSIDLKSVKLLSELPNLAERLEPPDGWIFSARVLDEDYTISSNGSALVIHDELGNGYQRKPPWDFEM